MIDALMTTLFCVLLVLLIVSASACIYCMWGVIIEERDERRRWLECRQSRRASRS